MKSIPFSFRQIDYLLAVAETGSTAAAARQLHVSQPSVSLAVSRIEQHFGQPLFLRAAGQGMHLTPFGRRKLAELRRLMAGAMAAFSSTPDGEASYELVLGVFSTLGPLHAPRLVRHFKEHHPSAKVTLAEDDLEGLLRALEAGRIDLALVYDVGLSGDVVLTALQDVRPHALVAEDHRLATAETVDLADLLHDPLILIDLPYSRSYFLSLLQMQGVSARIGAETGSIEMLRAMVANGLGVGLLATDLPYATAYDGRRVVQLDIAGDIPPHRIALARAANLPATSAAQAFIDMAKDIFSEMPQRPPETSRIADVV